MTLRLSSDPDIQGGDVCFEGTRIQVWCVWDYAAAGYSAEEIASEKVYPDLDVDQVRAAIALVRFKGQQ